jgi:hypothetical protein
MYPLYLNEHIRKLNKNPRAVDLVRQDLERKNLSPRPRSKFKFIDSRCPARQSAVFVTTALVAQNYREESDKVLHAVAGGGIAMTTACIFDSRAVGIIIACGTALLKEAYDKQNPRSHTTDIHDAMATCLAGTGIMIKGSAIVPGAISYSF